MGIDRYVLEKMGIDGYVLKDRKWGEYFGASEVNESDNFKWHSAPGRVGLEGKLTPEADNFLYAFLDRPEELYVVSPRSNPTIVRKSDRGARLESDVENPENIAKLLELLNQQKIYVFLTSIYDTGRYPTILTFSTTPPPEELYRSSSIISTNYLGQNHLEKETKSEFNPINKRFDYCEAGL